MSEARVIGKCGRGHIVNTVASEVRAGWITCECGSRAMAKFMDVRVVEEMNCSAKCTGATGPVCSCSCGGENHGGRNFYQKEN